MGVANFAMTSGVLLLAPLLICFALAIITGLVYMFFTTVLPLIEPVPFTLRYCAHVAVAMFLLFNVIFNYFLCVTTKHRGENYDIVVREMAEKTDFEFPEDEEGVREYEASYKKRMR
jgi:predicted membrane protein